MNLRWHCLLFTVFMIISAVTVLYKDGNAAPVVGDAAEVHNIAYNLAHGRGYRFDWDDHDWRQLWQSQNTDGQFDFILVRNGSHPTMFRPPLMPVLVAGILEIFPQHSFVAWRILDAAAFSVAACILCDVAFTQAGIIGFLTMLILLLSDPLRWRFIPGWWTEGFAFDFIAVLIWLLASGSKLRPPTFNLIAGITLGLLCLDRSMFVLLIPPLCVLLAVARFKPLSARAISTVLILAISVVVQLPWWIRNVEVSRRFLPLGTQGGFNLPDEYSNTAWYMRGEWTNHGITDAWIPRSRSDASILPPPGLTEESFNKLWIKPDRRFKATIYAAVCVSLQSEIAVSDAGQKSAKWWVRAHWRKIPRLMWFKVVTLTRNHQLALCIATLISAVGLFGGTPQRRTILWLAIFIALYVLAIALTHVVVDRFLIPILPPFYVAVSIGVGTLIQSVLPASTKGKLKAR